MPKNLSKLPPGKHADGNNLYLNVTAGGARHWSFRVMRNGRAHEFGLGSLADVSLAQARRKAAELRTRLVMDGIMPVPRRATAKPSTELTFRDAVQAFLRDAKWRSVKHAGNWRFTVETYALPILGNKSPSSITKSDVLAVIKPLWGEKQETASRLRGRIEQVLRHWAAHQDHLEAYANPAAWALLEHALGGKVNGRRHLKALHWSQVPQLMKWLAEQPGMAALALRFCVLTACRTGEVLGATWGEVDLEQRLWRIPAQRMKANTEHIVPLSAQALDVLTSLRSADTRVFPGLGKNAMLKLLQEWEPGVTTHGLRSGFRDWAAERGVSRELAEMALAHQVGSAVERAYLRSRLLEPRRGLMQQWAAFVCA